VDDLDKYVLEQAKTEVEHTRSWPTKILAFYAAINGAVVTGLFSLAARGATAPHTPDWVKWLLTAVLVSVAIWAWSLLVKNHLSYLVHRNVQVQFQKENKATIEQRQYPVPPEWFVTYSVNICTRLQGWGFYAVLVGLVAALSISGIWVS
jgi:hypothetical protein